jgi:hypothetical protein
MGDVKIFPGTMEEAAATLEQRVVDSPAHVTPVVAQTLARTLARVIDVADGLDDPAEMYHDALAEVDHNALAAFLLPAIDWGEMETEKPNKLLALAVAEEFGPNWAQVLYRFAVLVTKLA